MVAAVVHYFHHDLHLLDAVDGYAFLAIGNLTAGSISQQPGKDPRVAVILIDQKSNEDYYAGRSPLDRCQLTNDLTAIYKLPGPPKLLVIDLDLSPVLPELEGDAGAIARNQQAALCDKRLLKLLMQRRATDTVLMAPFKMLNLDARDSIATWRYTLGNSVTFAQTPTINIRFGLVNDIECKPDAIAATAYRRYSAKNGDKDNCLRHPASGEPLIINPGHYVSRLLPVSLSELPTRHGPSENRTKPVADALRQPVIFLGTSFGDDDTFLTPLGTMYGVEVHAAAFTSLLYPTIVDDVLAFFLDVGIALASGGSIALTWHRYFKFRFSSSALERQLAPWLLLLLVAFQIGALILITGGSYMMLRYCDIWLSPIPIAVGMLFESFFNSAVSSAVGEGYEQRRALVRRLQAAHASGPDSFASLATLEASQQPRHAHSLGERATRFIYTDFKGLRDKGHNGALALLFIRRATFLFLLGWLLLVVFWEPLHSFLERLS